MPITLTYFPIRGLGETIRIALHDLGVEYTDAYPENWPAFKQEHTANGNLAFGQLPFFDDTDNKVTMVQSGAILRHIGRKYGAYGTNEQDMCKVDIAIDGVTDWRRLYSKLVYTDKLEATAVTEYKATAIPLWTANFERFIGSNSFITGSSCTIADYALFDLVDTQLRIIPDLLDTTPLLKAWYGRMGERTGIKTYFASNPVHRDKANGNGLG